MKKSLMILLALVIFPAQAKNFGTQMQAQLIHSIYQECENDKSGLGKLRELMEFPKPEWCGCLMMEIQKQFEQNKLEQRLNDGTLILKDFEQEMEQVGGKAADICVNKFMK
ncbi:hypothetical protein [Actinobacillus porcinus]|uniref:hypothetical protein n=1 Tax=Actinobacillus porcinus TaxID=51048 RepID=UPI0023524FCF|nr:hypothetical protein [Actinobacillus porcinus]